jgi:KDO2-lipid IV(A) lauroyltransferase
MVTYWMLQCIRGTSRVLPSGLLRGIARMVTFLVFLALPSKRANVRRNMRVILGVEQQTASFADLRQLRLLAWRSMLSYGETLLDFINLDRLLPRVYADMHDVVGWEHLDGVLASGRGALFVGAHFGHWDLAGAALAKHCPPGSVYGVAEEFKDPRLNAMVVQQRSGYGIGIVPMENVRQMTRVLMRGHVLGILVDRPVTADDGVVVQFFGKETKIPAGAAVLATLARCPILPGYLARRPDGRFEGAILPPIEPSNSGSRAADIATTMQAVANALEEIIRRRPHQWFMFRNMWPDPALEPPGVAATAAPGIEQDITQYTGLRALLTLCYRRSGARLAYRLVVQTVRAVAALV